MAQVTGLSPTTILRGCNELKADLADCPAQHLRASGGGRPDAEIKDPCLEDILETILTSEPAGDPMDRRPKAKRSSLRRPSSALNRRDIQRAGQQLPSFCVSWTTHPRSTQDVSRRLAPRLHNATNSSSILVSNVKNSLRPTIPSSV
jgi:hypothetical protein